MPYPECPHQIKLQDCKTCSEQIISKVHYDGLMNAILLHPTSDECILGMTYKYIIKICLKKLIDRAWKHQAIFCIDDLQSHRCAVHAQIPKEAP